MTTLLTSLLYVFTFVCYCSNARRITNRYPAARRSYENYQLQRLYNNDYAFDDYYYDEDDYEDYNDYDDDYDYAEYALLEEEMEGPIKYMRQKWFDYKLSFVEDILGAYIQGSQELVQEKFEEQRAGILSSVDAWAEQHRTVAGIVGSPRLQSFKNWLSRIAEVVFNPLKATLKKAIEFGYNTAKRSMADERGLTFKEYAHRMKETEPESDAGRNFITQAIINKAFKWAIKFVNGQFQAQLDDIKRVVREQADTLTESVVQNVPFWKEWVREKLTQFVETLVRFSESTAKAVFNHAKEMIAKGKRIKYNKEKLNLAARIEYVNKLYYDVFYEKNNE